MCQKKSCEIRKMNNDGFFIVPYKKKYNLTLYIISNKRDCSTSARKRNYHYTIIRYAVETTEEWGAHCSKI